MKKFADAGTPDALRRAGWLSVTHAVARITLPVVFLLAAATSACAQTPAPTRPELPQCTGVGPALCPITDRPGLPRVLLIGDSISIGYTLPLRRLLEDRANVHRIPRNGGSTRIGLMNLDQWLENGKWDVIHVNFGLHDAKIGQDGNPAVDLEAYTQNVRTIIKRLRATGARVIWATTTPVPPEVTAPARSWADITAYNKAATRVALQEGAVIDDLYAVVKPQELELQRPENVHFNRDGSATLARAVADSIGAQLRRK